LPGFLTVQQVVVSNNAKAHAFHNTWYS